MTAVDDGCPVIDAMPRCGGSVSKFPKQFPNGVEVEDVDLDTVDVRHQGERLTEAGAEQIAADVLSRDAGGSTRAEQM